MPPSWDAEGGVCEFAFVTRAFDRGGRPVDQLQMHLVGAGGAHRIVTVCFDDANLFSSSRTGRCKRRVQAG